MPVNVCPIFSVLLLPSAAAELLGAAVDDMMTVRASRVTVFVTVTVRVFVVVQPTTDTPAIRTTDMASRRMIRPL